MTVEAIAGGYSYSIFCVAIEDLFSGYGILSVKGCKQVVPSCVIRVPNFAVSTMIRPATAVVNVFVIVSFPVSSLASVIGTQHDVNRNRWLMKRIDRHTYSRVHVHTRIAGKTQSR